MDYRGKRCFSVEKGSVLTPFGDYPVKWYWDVMLRKTKLEWKNKCQEKKLKKS
jgi:hypothetical protein